MKLKHCPFCGNQVEITTEHNIEVDGCSIRGIFSAEIKHGCVSGFREETEIGGEQDNINTGYVFAQLEKIVTYRWNKRSRKQQYN